MATATKKTETKETKAIDTKLSTEELTNMLPEANEKKNLTAEELIKLVNEKFNQVLTKSAMLKLLRLEGYSVAQNRCYNAYLQIEKAVNAKQLSTVEISSKEK